MLVPSRAKDEFNVVPEISPAMAEFISRCGRIYGGNPDWLDDADHITTVNFAKSVCSEVARLTMMGTKIQLDGSARAAWLQSEIDRVYSQLRHWIEYGCGYGTVILKPNGNGIDFLTPGRFMITESDNGEIRGIVFYDQQQDSLTGKWFTRYEYHRFEGDAYIITNRCYIGDSQADKGKPIDISLSPWAGLAEEVTAEHVDKMLFGVFRTPIANNIDVGSPMGMPIFAEALQELADLDVAYSRNIKEIIDSKRTVLMDSDRLLPRGVKISAAHYNNALHAAAVLPDYVKLVDGNGADDMYHEINPTLETDKRLTGINALLSQIGFKCGFSNGYFVFNEKSGMITATQVEADDRRTIQLIKDVRDQLQACIDGLLYALDKFADAYALAPRGAYEPVYDFGDITYNREEDKARWYSYVTAGRVPFWYYLVKFEGYTEEDAKKLEAAARLKETLFGDEE